MPLGEESMLHRVGEWNLIKHWNLQKL
jgi:hypothetical protein